MGRARTLLVFGAATALLAACTNSTPATSTTPTGYVPWLPLPAQGQFVSAPGNTAPPGPPVAIPAGTPACAASQLEAKSGWQGAAAGNADTPIVFRNRGASRCFIEGYPDVTVLDRRGAVLAHAKGSTARGTYFDSWPVVPVLMEPGTPAFPADVFPNVASMPSLQGEAFMNMSWYNCRQPQAASLVLAMPGAGGRLTTPYAFRGFVSPACGNPGVIADGLYRGPISPAGYPAPSGYVFSNVSVSLQVPAGAHLGYGLTYYVTLTNHDLGVYPLEPCADYHEILDKALIKTYQLNCLPIRRLAPGGSATFQMKYSIPASMEGGTHVLSWVLMDGRVSQNSATVTIEID